MKVLCGKFSFKLAQKYGDFLGYFENMTYKEKTTKATFWGNHRKNLWYILVDKVRLDEIYRHIDWPNQELMSKTNFSISMLK